MRRKEKKISDDRAMSLLEQGEYGVLSCVTDGDAAYGVPLNYCVMDGALYFHCALTGKKLDALTANPSVSFCVVGATKVLAQEFSTKYESCIVEGQATEVVAEEKGRVLTALIDKYSSQFQKEGAEYIRKAGHMTRVIKIIPQSIVGKAGD